VWRWLGLVERRASNTTSTSSTGLWTPPGADVGARAAGVERSGGGYRRPEPWVTKRQLAEHLKVTVRWIETQHHLGLPYVRRGGVVRYRISEVEAWLRRMSGA
jgi:hypothetical protein